MARAEVTAAAIRLRAIESDDLPQLRDWRNGLLELGVVREYRALSMLNQEAWHKRMAEARDHVMFAVEAAEATATAAYGQLIGVCGHTYIDWPRRRSEISIYIGNKSCRGRGFGRVTLEALVAYGFNKLGFRRQYGEIMSFNAANLRLFSAVGFKEEGRLREHHFHNGKWHDAVMMGLLEHEWRERR